MSASQCTREQERLHDKGKIRLSTGSMHCSSCAEDDLFVRFWK